MTPTSSNYPHILSEETVVAFCIATQGTGGHPQVATVQVQVCYCYLSPHISIVTTSKLLMERKEPSADSRHFPILSLIALMYLLLKPVVSVQVYCRRLWWSTSLSKDKFPANSHCTVWWLYSLPWVPGIYSTARLKQALTTPLCLAITHTSKMGKGILSIQLHISILVKRRPIHKAYNVRVVAKIFRGMVCAHIYHNS